MRRRGTSPFVTQNDCFPSVTENSDSADAIGLSNVDSLSVAMLRLPRFVCRRTLRALLTVVRFALHLVLGLFREGARTVVPPVRDPLLLRSATSLAADIRTGKLKSEEVVRAYVARIAEVNSFINAAAQSDFRETEREARDVDRLVASADDALRRRLAVEKPFLGVPFSVKSLIQVRGMSAEWGSWQYAGAVAPVDAEVVRLMKEAGALFLALTNVPELGMGIESVNALYGRTCNPYDRRRTSGGSTGGEAALLGAAGSVLGLGNDMGGSIRLPCAFTGIFGHKPSRGAVSNAGTFPWRTEATDKYVVAGPMCRYAEDLTPAMRLLNRGAALPLDFGGAVDFRKVKIYYKLSMDNEVTVPELSGEYVRMLKKAVAYFEDTYGTKTEELTSLDLSQSTAIAIHSILSELDIVDTVLPNRPDFGLTNELLRFVTGRSRMTYRPLLAMLALRLPCVYRPRCIPRYRTLLSKVEAAFEEALDDHSVFLYPSFSQVAPLHHEASLVAWSLGYTAIFNVLGMPVTQCPLGLDMGGMPLGVQVVGRKGADPLTLAFAEEFEKVFGGWIEPSVERK